jgi:hypothetical protein
MTAEILRFGVPGIRNSEFGIRKTPLAWSGVSSSFPHSTFHIPNSGRGVADA